MAIIFLIKKLAQSKGQAMEPPNGSDEALETKTHVVSVKKKTCFQCSHGITLSYVYIYIYFILIFVEQNSQNCHVMGSSRYCSPRNSRCPSLLIRGP
jgi:hypothetical protein